MAAVVDAPDQSAGVTKVHNPPQKFKDMHLSPGTEPQLFLADFVQLLFSITFHQQTA